MTNLRSTTLASLLAFSSAGCFFDGSYCEENGCAGAGGASGASTTGTLTASQSSTQSSSSTGIDPTCIPSEATWMPNEGCGVFVMAGASGDGKPTSPIGSIGDAVALGGDKPIYVCVGPETLDESVERTAPITLFGGLDCTTWLPTTDKTEWTAPANSVPLILRPGANGSHIEGFAITAANAMGNDAGTRQGNSSIALLADGVTATLQRLELAAGSGANGGDAMDHTEQAPGRQSDAMAFDGKEGGDCGGNGGPSVTYDTCPSGGSTVSGEGGKGNQMVGAGGLGGAPDPSMGEPNGDGGAGEPNAGMWDCSVNGGNGEAGHPGPSGNPGGGGTGLGMLSTSGYVGPTSGAGTNGTIAQGGGGGGGRKGNGANTCNVGVAGPSGGSGGAGGCGGLGAAGGGAGGASIALLSFNATLTTIDVTLAAGSGGEGGDGGDGQLGGVGGAGGFGGGVACQGGNGGKGGDGAGGGGGKGGPSIGLAYVGEAPSIADADITIASVAALAGMPGGGNVPGLSGEAGVLSKKQPF